MIAEHVAAAAPSCCRSPCRSACGGIRAEDCGESSRARTWPALSSVALGRWSRSDQIPSVSERNTSSMRSGSAPGRPGAAGFRGVPGSQLLRHWPSTIFWIPRMRSSTEISTPGPKTPPSEPQCDQRSVPSRRSRAGENWNDLSERIASVRNFRHSRCLAPATGTIGSCAPLSAL